MAGNAELQFHTSILGGGRIGVGNDNDAFNAVSGVSDMGEPIEIKLERLDDVIELAVPIKLLKIDVEGQEVEVIRGASKIHDRKSDSFCYC